MDTHKQNKDTVANTVNANPIFTLGQSLNQPHYIGMQYGPLSNMFEPQHQPHLPMYGGMQESPFIRPHQLNQYINKIPVVPQLNFNNNPQLTMKTHLQNVPVTDQLQLGGSRALVDICAPENALTLNMKTCTTASTHLTEQELINNNTVHTSPLSAISGHATSTVSSSPLLKNCSSMVLSQREDRNVAGKDNITFNNEDFLKSIHTVMNEAHPSQNVVQIGNSIHVGNTVPHNSVPVSNTVHAGNSEHSRNSVPVGNTLHSGNSEHGRTYMPDDSDLRSNVRMNTDEGVNLFKLSKAKDTAKMDTFNSIVPGINNKKEERTVTTPVEHCIENLNETEGYICGCCMNIFPVLCSLQKHLLTMHGCEGSFVYNHSTRTAYPKFEPVNEYSQTDNDTWLADEHVRSTPNCEQSDVHVDMTVKTDVKAKSHQTRGQKRTSKNEQMNAVEQQVDKPKKRRKRKTRPSKSRQRLTEQCKSTVNVDHTSSTNGDAIKQEAVVAVKVEILADEIDVTRTELSDTETAIVHNELNNAYDTDSYDVEEYTNKDTSKDRYEKSKRKHKTDPNIVNIENGRYMCKICNDEIDSYRKCRYHIKENHSKLTKSSAKLGNRPRHKQTECKWCGDVFTSAKLCSEHIPQCDSNQKLKCQICETRFQTVSEVNSHIISHTMTEKLSCKKCTKAFTNIVYLHNHLLRHAEVRRVQCEYCGKSVNGGRALVYHLRHCNEERSQACGQCYQTFKTKHALKDHMAIHSEERPYVCHMCGYAVKKASYLKRHIRSHTGERPYACQDCGASFSAMNGLNRHRRIHTNTKPYVCEYCTKSFTNNWNLKTHLRQHTGDTPYSCEMCGKSFKQNVLLRLHNKSHHPGM